MRGNTASPSGSRPKHSVPGRSFTRRLEDFRTVGRGHYDHAAIGLETIHLHQQLIACLLPLLVRAESSHTARPAERIKLVDENDARGKLACLMKQIAHPRGADADADEQLDKLRTADQQKRNIRLASDRLREQRLASTRRSNDQYSFGDVARASCSSEPLWPREQNCFGTAMPDASRVSACSREPSPPARASAQLCPASQ